MSTNLYKTWHVHQGSGPNLNGVIHKYLSSEKWKYYMGPVRTNRIKARKEILWFPLVREVAISFPALADMRLVLGEFRGTK
jgi:hypothetical protein